MSDEYIPTLTHAIERDIDLLLVEELYASPEFVAWMARRAGMSPLFVGSRVLHSKRRTRNRREIDIFVEISAEGGQLSGLLIENKLTEPEQERQAESYREEIARIRSDYSEAAMLIVCPKAYHVQNFEFTSKFDSVVMYEELHAYFSKRAGEAGPLARRMAFRAEILDQAIHKRRRGYMPVPNEVVGDFNARYVALLSEVMPDIRPGKSMLQPANPDESTSMIFDHGASLAELPKDIRPRRFAHELGRGSKRRANYVAVTFGGWGVALPHIKERLKEDAANLGAAFEAKPPKKGRSNPGLVMSIPSPPVDNQKSFDEQSRLLIEGMEQAGLLRRWLLDNQDILRSWQALVEQHKERA